MKYKEELRAVQFMRALSGEKVTGYLDDDGRTYELHAESRCFLNFRYSIKRAEGGNHLYILGTDDKTDAALNAMGWPVEMHEAQVHSGFALSAAALSYKLNETVCVSHIYGHSAGAAIGAILCREWGIEGTFFACPPVGDERFHNQISDDCAFYRVNTDRVPKLRRWLEFTGHPYTKPIDETRLQQPGGWFHETRSFLNGSGHYLSTYADALIAAG